ncbi:MAG: glutamate 2,3-aminomutase [Clostridia bacterium]|jgi:lysine 2,3-aminomutase|nr:KamA2 [Clostridiales bacterium]MDK2985783.1 glutamate 2,3-aminomutase [Clostridia bacterium]
MKFEEKRKIALDRASELKSRIEPYLEAREKIPAGLNMQQEFDRNKKKIMDYFGAGEDEWNDWRWQLRHCISDVETLSNFIDLSDEEKEEIKKAGEKYRWSISPYYLSLVDPKDRDCPIWKQGIPSMLEINDPHGVADPMAEEFTSPADRITRRYPDRLIINVTNQCAMFCRHCQRKRNIGEVDKAAPREEVQKAIDYVRNNPEIRDVLITGGDPLTLSNERLEEYISQLWDIPSVEIIRIGSRTPVTMPQRITQELCDMLEKYPPIYVNTHFNHPKEVTHEALKACRRLAKAGIAIGNQAVLLKEINNDPHIMKKLNHELLKIHVRPYYIFHAKSVKGTTHFVPRVEEGIEIMENLRGYTSGMAIPTYIINAPDGNGKTPILPQYLISQGKGYVTIRTWEGKVFKYPNGYDLEE